MWGGGQPPSGERLPVAAKSVTSVDAEPHRRSLCEALTYAIGRVEAAGDRRSPEHAMHLRWLRAVIREGEAETGFYALGLADGAQGTGHVFQACLDPEAYARAYNEGYADAQRHTHVEPFEQALAVVRRMMRESGGAAQFAYMQAGDLIEAALREYDDLEDGEPR